MGAGGNFGVVSTFWFKTHTIPTISQTTANYKISHLLEKISRDNCADAKSEINNFFVNYYKLCAVAERNETFYLFLSPESFLIYGVVIAPPEGFSEGEEPEQLISE